MHVGYRVNFNRNKNARNKLHKFNQISAVIKTILKLKIPRYSTNSLNVVAVLTIIKKNSLETEVV